MLAVKRLTRAEQNERNRALVLDAAREVFLARGYHGATVEEIADEAGFSRGVVYSQFGTKADLLMALLDRRIDELTEQSAAPARGLSGVEGAVALVEQAAGRERDDPGWALLLIEFRVHAARDPELNKRYAAAHRRTIERLAAVLAAMYERAGQDPPFPPDQLAELVFALASGAQLEHAANPEALPASSRGKTLRRLLAADAAAPKATLDHLAVRRTT
jgi:AcrR family transcriptional regulator